MIAEVAQSFVARQEVQVGQFMFVFDAELCFIKVSTATCYLVPYSLIVCFADMCASWFSLDCYASLYTSTYTSTQVSLYIVRFNDA